MTARADTPTYEQLHVASRAGVIQHGYFYTPGNVSLQRIPHPVRMSRLTAPRAQGETSLLLRITTSSIEGR